MKLAREFIRLPFKFDVERLTHEVQALPQHAWQAHPTGYKGNTAVPLVSVNGKANDLLSGPMAQTPWLEQSPYIRQVLSAFQVVFGRTRLMGLAGGYKVPMHRDVNYHWFTRVRIHIPIITYPEVGFHCNGKEIHMAAGEAWVFDNWKTHHVDNPTTQNRVHLVADTVGSSIFWQMVDQSLSATERELNPKKIAYQPAESPQLRFEKFNSQKVMHPSEMELLTEDLIEDLEQADSGNPEEQVDKFIRTVRGFYQDWKSIWVVNGEDEHAKDIYENRRNRLLKDLLAIRQPLVLKSNGTLAQKIMLARVIIACVDRPVPGLNEIQFAN
jgi:hypothetical protein